MDEDKAHQIPQGFIQEGGMVVSTLAGDGVDEPHPQEGIGHTAVGFPVEEIAPAAHHLADHKAQGYQIQGCQNGDLLKDLAVDDHTDGGADDSAVDGNTAFPDIENGDGVGGILLPFKGAVVKPGAENGEGSNPQYTVQQIVFGKTELLFPAQGIAYCQDQTHGNDEAVKAHLKAADGKTGGGIEGQSQTGKFDDIVGHFTSSSFGRITARLILSRVMVFFRKLHTSAP